MTELSKPVWWVSVVIAGIIINLFSSYLKNQLDRTISDTSSWWRNRSTARKQSYDKSVQRIQMDPAARQAVTVREFRYRIQSVHLALAAVMVLVLPIFLNSLAASFPPWANAVLLCFSGLTFFASFLAFRSAAYLADMQRAAGES